jgi:nucleotide-binding universal stress UspA family protein
MFEKILFPTDFSEFAQRMLNCITEIPGVREVVLLNIIDATQYSIHGWTHESERENAKILMQEKKKLLEEQGLNVVTHVDAITSGTMSQRILEVAEQETVSLTIMGTHQKTSIDTFLHGSVSYDLLHHMTTHVLIVRQNATDCDRRNTTENTCPHIFSKVLVPVDFTENSREMLSFVRGMQGLREIVLLHVVTEGETKQEIDQGVVNASEELLKIQKDLEEAGFLVTVRVRVGNAVEMIVALAEEVNCSLILMYAHKRNWIEKFLQDSTPFSVVRNAKKPVLVLRLG